MYLSIKGSNATAQDQADFDEAVNIAAPNKDAWAGGQTFGPEGSVGQAVDATEAQAIECMAFAAKTKNVKVAKIKKQ